MWGRSSSGTEAFKASRDWPSIGVRFLIVCLTLMFGCGPQADADSRGTSSTSDAAGETLTPSDASASSGLTATGAATADETSGAGFIFNPDLPPGACDIFEQNCPEGSKCTFYSDSPVGGFHAMKCVEVAPNPARPGERCSTLGHARSGLDDCDATSMCLNVDQETLQGRCLRYCIGCWSDPGCAEPCEFCTVNPSIFSVCLPICDPLNPATCGEGLGCYPLAEHYACALDSSEPDAGVGSPCEHLTGCPSGSSCRDAAEVPSCESVGCCSPLCRVDADDSCSEVLPGTVCTPIFEDNGPSTACLPSEEVGVCSLPR